MTSTNPDPRIGGYSHEVEHQKPGPALLIASSLVLAGLLDGVQLTVIAFRMSNGTKRLNIGFESRRSSYLI
jgi:hypothetical protein